MRIVLSLLTLDPRIAGGSERYVRGLCGGLAAVATEEVLAVVPRNATDVTGRLPALVAEGVPVARGPAQRVRTLAGLRLRPGSLARVVAEADVVHYPVTVPLPASDCPTVVTLHDLQHLEHPELFSAAKRRFRARWYDAAVRRADRVIAISGWVAARAIELLELDPSHVHVAPHGVEERWFAGGGPREPFLLYPARGWPHKNHSRLFEAFALVRHDHPDLRLVLTGGGHDFTSLPPGVESRGHVDDDTLASLYARAAALVFPSLSEGFGLPVLEAMAAGCPVAASIAGGLPEVTGEHAATFDPTDVEAIARAIDDALELTPAQLEAARDHARTFSWQTSARIHLDVYRKAA
ncbi:MAG: glycosyltransferase family 1 protein [Gaiellales bacterium]